MRREVLFCRSPPSGRPWHRNVTAPSACRALGALHLGSLHITAVPAGMHPVRDHLSRRSAWFGAPVCVRFLRVVFPQSGLLVTERSLRRTAGFRAATAARATFCAAFLCRSAPCARHPFAPVCSTRSSDMQLAMSSLLSSATGLACDRRKSLWSRGLPSRCRGPGHFSLLAQRKVTKRKSTPRGAVWASPSQSVRRPGFSTGLLPGRKVPDIRVGHPCGA